jgi:hypothetical protein
VPFGGVLASDFAIADLEGREKSSSVSLESLARTKPRCVEFTTFLFAEVVTDLDLPSATSDPLDCFSSEDPDELEPPEDGKDVVVEGVATLEVSGFVAGGCWG